MDNKEVRAYWEEIKVKNREDFFKKLNIMRCNFIQYIKEHENNMNEKDKKLLYTVEKYFMALISLEETIDHLIFRIVNYAKEE